MIIWLWHVIVGGCFHKWKTIERQPVFVIKADGTKRDMPTAFDFVMQCERCGNIKVKRT